MIIFICLFAYLFIGVLFAAILEYIDDVRIFCELLFVLIGWPICLFMASITALVCGGVYLVNYVRRACKCD